MPSSLTLSAFSDRALLYALERSANELGWATAQEIADEIGITHDHPAHCVGSRLAWLNRFGVMETEVDKGQTFWRLNETGYAIVHPPKKLPAAIERALEGLDEGQRVAVTEAISKDLPASSREGAHMARRAWQHNFGAWRDATIAPQRS